MKIIHVPPALEQARNMQINATLRMLVNSFTDCEYCGSFPCECEENERAVDQYIQDQYANQRA